MAISVNKTVTEETTEEKEIAVQLETEEVVTPVVAEKKSSISLGAVTFTDRSPCNWHIVELDDGMIEARNSNSGETFTGNLEDFNASLRG